MKIDDYRFGRIVVGGTEYRADLVVFHDRVCPNWWRREGHRLHGGDLGEVLAAKPSTLIVGCGALGMLRIPEETRALLKGARIELVELSTAAACEEYNRHADEPLVVGAFHLTC